ncbi:ATP-binding protein [Streptomyces sp. SH5]|uniref:ATP-binding protein n=1 Tax=Streptomyces sp. SH5 TaxID=3041765 RepID=UPI0032B06527
MWRLPEDEDSRTAMTTVVSELVTNAVSHGTGDTLSVTVRADTRRSRLLLEVHDNSPVLPLLHCPGPDSESGRGMVLVGHLSIACGAENTVRGKRVWAELALPRESAGRWRAFECLGPPPAIVERLLNAFRPPSVRSPANRRLSAAADGPSASGPTWSVRPGLSDPVCPTRQQVTHHPTRRREHEPASDHGAHRRKRPAPRRDR